MKLNERHSKEPNKKLIEDPGDFKQSSFQPPFVDSLAVCVFLLILHISLLQLSCVEMNWTKEFIHLILSTKETFHLFCLPFSAMALLSIWTNTALQCSHLFVFSENRQW